MTSGPTSAVRRPAGPPECAPQILHLCHNWRQRRPRTDHDLIGDPGGRSGPVTKPYPFTCRAAYCMAAPGARGAAARAGRFHARSGGRLGPARRRLTACGSSLPETDSGQAAPERDTGRARRHLRAACIRKPGIGITANSGEPAHAGNCIAERVTFFSTADPSAGRLRVDSDCYHHQIDCRLK